ncbi:IclR family transcriptional regulator [Neomicrococcus aestuarii]|uniref:ArsR family transcriptional regulator n=1 Tax=Neomicrococcus aestuarii TaxID=556325 RepID=A0A1L2ZQ20_9MICC|nr:IclR family transcriptional regulator [Neomicrococcus aestuarii]APF41092.1 ArsR family transcriptional regulator [Neomicrococcus aestuarii]
MSEEAAAAGKATREGSSVIANVFEVLKCFTVDQPLLGVTEIAARVGLHKSSVSRILSTLELLEIVERDEESRKFRLGLGLISVAGPLLAGLDIRRLALPFMRELAEETQESVALQVWSGSESVTVEQVPSPQQIKHMAALGTRYSTYESASVQVLESHANPTKAHSKATLKELSEQGYLANYGRTSPDEVGVSAPVFDHRGEVVGAIITLAPRYRVPEERVADLGQATRDCAARISARMGAPGEA